MKSIPLQSFDLIESTSTYCQKLLKDKSPPFAVFAHKQSGGRGRRGKDWQSPEGGVYLSLVLPSPEISLINKSLLSLRAALCFCWWLEETFCFRATLKWPNDILFSGAKLAGILCESQIQGDHWGPVVIGIGLNVNKTPKINDDYRVISLKEIMAEHYSPLQLAEDLCQKWLEYWQKSNEDDVILDGIKRYEIAAGQAWIDAERREQIYLNQGIGEDGQFYLNELDDPTVRISLVSASHHYYWAYQTRSCRLPLIVADVGNTASKLAVYRNVTDKTPSEYFVLAHGQALDALHLHKLNEWKDKSNKPFPVYALSVNKGALVKLSNSLSFAGFKVIEVKKSPVRVHGEHYMLSQLGGDRLAVMEAWLSSLSEDQRRADVAGLLVCAGTATTIDWVSGKGLHRGGFIVPGVQLALHSLSLEADLLPRVNINDVAPTLKDFFWGNDTVSAMTCGYLQMTISFIQEAMRRAKKDEGPDHQLDLVVSGGYGQILSQMLGTGYQPDLVLNGIKTMIIRG